jgi:hypothetical protein
MAASILCLAGMIMLPGIPGFAQLLQPTLNVNGTPLVTTRPVTRVGQEWFLPLVPIAKALGIDISVSTEKQVVLARNQTGAEVTYDGRTGEIRHGFVLVAQVKNYKQIQFAVPNDEDLLFPLGGVVALLGVDIEEDPDHNVLRIESTREGAPTQNPTAPAFSMTALGYDYGLTTNFQDYSQFINLRGDGVTGFARIKGNVLLSRYPGQPLLNFSQGTLQLELPKERELVLGDQGINAGLEALTNTVRGVGFEAPVKGFRLDLYGGQSMSASFGSLGGSFTQYDNKIAGFALRKKTKTEELAFGGHYFTSADRHGTTFGFAYGRLSKWNHFKSQIVFGQFAGLSSRSILLSSASLPSSEISNTQSAGLQGGDTTPGGTSPAASGQSSAAQVLVPVRVDGPAFGLTINDTLTPIKQLSISGQFDQYSRNFLTPRLDPRFSGQSNEALSLAFRPIQNISLTAGINNREYLLGEPSHLSGQNFGALATLPLRQTVQFGFFRSVQSDSASPLGKMFLTQFSFAVPNFNRYSAYAYYTETGFPGESARHLNTVFAIDLRSRGRITLNDQLQLHNTHRYGLDWYLDLPKSNAFIRIGVDRSQALNTSAGWYPLVGLKIPLPRGHSLQISYLADRDSRTLRVETGGSPIREPERRTGAEGARSFLRLAQVTGRVFLDENLNGILDKAVDQPIANVQVRLDGTQVAFTDARGFFRFEQVDPGAHSVRADLEGLPADMVFADVAEKTIAVLPYRENALNFSVVRTGRITGEVTCMDYRGDPDKPIERPLPDVRIVAESKHDTFSELKGDFLLGDLPPGTYEVKLDPATLPEGYVPQPVSIRAVIKPGETVRDVAFRLVVPPKPVVQKILPPQSAEFPVSGAQGLALAKQDPPKMAETSQQPQLQPPCQFQIQVYSAHTRQDAEARADKLRRLGFSCSITGVQLNGNETWYMVRLLGFDSRESAIAAGEMLRTKGIIDDYSIIQLVSPPVSK